MQRLSYNFEPSAMYYHNGMANASYMHDGPPMDPRYFWPPPPSGAGGSSTPPPGYSNPFTPPPTDDKPSGSGTQRSEASTSTEASTNTDSEAAGAEASAASGGATGGATGGAMAAGASKEELTISTGESSTQAAPMQDIDLLD